MTKEIKEGSKSDQVMEIFIRMNEDDEKDYCFAVNENDTFGDLDQIFKKLPLKLSPSIFYERYPAGYSINQAPGLLTLSGGLLFGDDAGKTKYTKIVSKDDKIAETCWPGQLIMPVWRKDSTIELTAYSALFIWLYTDLPDFISPTPGICISNQIIKLGCHLLKRFGALALGEALEQDLLDEYSPVLQCVFFFLHIIKIFVIWLALYTGLINPISFVPGAKLPKIDRDDLLNIGWTGARKATFVQFHTKYRNLQIAKCGGILKAHSDGILEKLRKTTLKLGEGEGWSTPVPKDPFNDPVNLKTLAKSKKFQLCYDLIAKQAISFQKKIIEIENEEKKNSEVDSNTTTTATAKDTESQEELNHQEKLAAAVKDFRRFGPLDTTPDIQEIVDKRFALGDGTVSDDDSN